MGNTKIKLLTVYEKRHDGGTYDIPVTVAKVTDIESGESQYVVPFNLYRDNGDPCNHVDVYTKSMLFKRFSLKYKEY